MQGITRNVELLGGDARDALNLPLHWRRKPLGTTAVAGAIALLLVAVGRRSRRGGRGRGRTIGYSSLIRALLGTGLTGALLGRFVKAVGLVPD